MSVLSVLPGAPYVEHVGRFYAPGVKHAQGNLSKEAEAVLKAAERFHINPVVLWGVFGAETAHGTDVKASSAGAVGPFQFLPSTAKQYGYPTNVNTNGITNFQGFQLQANAAARYLASLLPRAGTPGRESEASWEKALRAYSGGGYGYAHVKTEGASFAGIFGGEGANKQETAHVEENPTSKKGILAEIQQFIEKFTVTAILLVAGVVLVVYGIMVAVGKTPRPMPPVFA